VGRVYVIGSINTDLVVRAPRFPAPGETVLGEAFATFGGGKGANQAIAASRMGARVAMVGVVGDDPFSAQRLDELLAEGVDIAAIVRRRGVPGGVALILVARSGENAITVVPGANETLTSGEVETALRDQLARRDLVCVQLEIPLAAARSALAVARAVGATGVLNATPFSPAARELIGLADLLVVNGLEACQLAGSGHAGVDAALDQLHRAGAREVVVTLGAEGALFSLHTGRFRLRAPEVEVVDTTAAGDAFIGTLVALLAEGRDWEHVAERAVWAGALAVQREGAQPSLPRRDQVEQAARTRPLVPEAIARLE
jgi:ribokinase